MRYPLTRRLYQDIMGEDPSYPEGESDTRPAKQMNWFKAVEFCNRLSEREGLAPCYQTDEENKVSWNQSADGYRLPTEAEWEYACRAGSSTAYCFGDSEEELKDYAWYGMKWEDGSQRVGQKIPNRWGLYDMHGNVWEWCWDWYADYPKEDQSDPAGPKEGKERVLRGGACSNPARLLRSALRIWFWIENRDVGFRCVRGPRRQP
jgi:formylglycine-generating enzyme required for sulfatase activity